MRAGCRVLVLDIPGRTVHYLPDARHVGTTVWRAQQSRTTGDLTTGHCGREREKRRRNDAPSNPAMHEDSWRSVTGVTV